MAIYTSLYKIVRFYSLDILLKRYCQCRAVIEDAFNRNVFSVQVEEAEW